MKKLIDRIVTWSRTKNWACDTYENQFVLGYKNYRDATTRDERVTWAKFCVNTLEKIAELDRTWAQKLEHNFDDELEEMKSMILKESWGL